MYRDRIIEQKKILGLSLKAMSERSKLHLPEETISRFLTNKTSDSRVSTMLDVCASVELEPYELFMDAQTAAEFKLYLETKSSIANKDEAVSSLLSQNIKLQDEITALNTEIDRLKLKLEYEEKINLLHDRYNKYIDSLK